MRGSFWNSTCTEIFSTAWLTVACLISSWVFPLTSTLFLLYKSILWLNIWHQVFYIQSKCHLPLQSLNICKVMFLLKPNYDDFEYLWDFVRVRVFLENLGIFFIAPYPQWWCFIYVLIQIQSSSWLCPFNQCAMLLAQTQMFLIKYPLIQAQLSVTNDHYFGTPIFPLAIQPEYRTKSWCSSLQHRLSFSWRFINDLELFAIRYSYPWACRPWKSHKTHPM